LWGLFFAKAVLSIQPEKEWYNRVWFTLIHKGMFIVMIERIHIEGSGSPLLMLHGGAGPFVLLPLAHALSRYYKVILPCLPGFHPEDREPEYSLDSCLRYVQALREEMELDGCPVVGYSEGGRIALEDALANAEQIPSLVLLAPTGMRNTAPVVPGPRWLTRMALDLMLKHEMPIAADEFGDRHTPDKTAYLTQYKKLMADPRFRRFYASLVVQNAKASKHWPSRLPKLRTPTLLLWGSEDRAVPMATAAFFQKYLPVCGLEMIEGYGHLAVLEKPGFFGKQITAFVGTEVSV
jgi:pimeloyl-ACP methyl ester carboxylesterase